MGERGPLPDARLRVLTRADREIRRVPRPVPVEPPKPDGLGEVGSATWDAIVPELVRLRLIGRLDGPLVEMFCVSYEKWRAHPGGTGYAALTNAVSKLGRDIGLGAASRLRKEKPPRDPAIFGMDDPWDAG